MRLPGRLREPVRRAGVADVGRAGGERVVPLSRAAHHGTAAVGDHDTRVVDDEADVEPEPLGAAPVEQQPADGAGAVTDAPATERLQQDRSRTHPRPAADEPVLQALLPEGAAERCGQRFRHHEVEAAGVDRPQRQPQPAAEPLRQVADGERRHQRATVGASHVQPVGARGQQHRFAEQVGAERDRRGERPGRPVDGHCTRRPAGRGDLDPEADLGLALQGQHVLVEHGVGDQDLAVRRPGGARPLQQVHPRPFTDGHRHLPGARGPARQVRGRDGRGEAAPAVVLVRAGGPQVQAVVVAWAHGHGTPTGAVGGRHGHGGAAPTAAVLQERRSLELQGALAARRARDRAPQPPVDVLHGAPRVVGRGREPGRDDRPAVRAVDRQPVRVVGQVVLDQREVVEGAPASRPGRQPRLQRDRRQHRRGHPPGQPGRRRREHVERRLPTGHRVGVGPRQQVGQQAGLPGLLDHRGLVGHQRVDAFQAGQVPGQDTGTEAVLLGHRPGGLPVVTLVDHVRDGVDRRRRQQHPGHLDGRRLPLGHGSRGPPAVEPEQLAREVEVHDQVGPRGHRRTTGAVEDRRRPGHLLTPPATDVDVCPQDEVGAGRVQHRGEPLEGALRNDVVRVHEREVRPVRPPGARRAGRSTPALRGPDGPDGPRGDGCPRWPARRPVRPGRPVPRRGARRGAGARSPGRCPGTRRGAHTDHAPARPR